MMVESGINLRFFMGKVGGEDVKRVLTGYGIL